MIDGDSRLCLSLFGFLASGALMVHVMTGGYTDLDTRWGWAINVACPAHVLITQFFAFQNDGTPLMMLVWLGDDCAQCWLSGLQLGRYSLSSLAPARLFEPANFEACCSIFR